MPAAQSYESDSEDDETLPREVHWVDETRGRSSSSVAVRSSGCAEWPQHYKEIQRVQFENRLHAADILVHAAREQQPVIMEGAKIIDVNKWSELEYLQQMLKDKQVLVKRSPDEYFRYFDMKKNTGNFAFEKPIEELQRTFGEFLAESERLLEDGSPQRMYLQETLAGHEEMSKEFGTWDWDLLLAVSQTCGWGLPDSNELFIGMQGVETPLHFDERENLFFQVRGRKDICLFPWTDYVRLYPFPLTHPCDRQSMVGTPQEPDLEAFPRFAEATGFTAQLRAGDLIYIPYGWWHWLRNLDHMAVSVSFWSLTKSADVHKSIPGQLSASMFTRVRRNLELMIADEDTAKLCDTMLEIRGALLDGREDHRLKSLRALLEAVKLPAPLQDRFILEIIDGRFGIDWQRHVPGSGRRTRRAQSRPG